MTKKTPRSNRPASASSDPRSARRSIAPAYRKLYGTTEDPPETTRTGSLKATSRPVRAARLENQTPLPVPSLERVIQNPARALDELARVRGAFKQARQGYREEIYAALAQAYGIAVVYRHDEDPWLDFCRHRDWSGFKGIRPSRSTRQDALRYVLRFAVGFDGKSATKRANKLVAALDPAFKKNLSPAAVPGYIREGRGIEALARANAKRKANSSPTPKLITVRIPMRADSAGLLSQEPGETVSLAITIKAIHGAVIDAELQSLSTDPGR